MAKIALPYTIINGDPVDAGPVQSDYTTIERHINQELIERGGTVAMTAQLKLAGNPVAALDAAPKQYVDQMLPIGIITMFAGTGSPPGGIWLACDGTQYEVVAYPILAAIVGGVTGGTFRVPDLKDRFAIGSGGVYGVGATGGSHDAIVAPHTHPIDHTHPATTTEIQNAAHNHDLTAHGHPFSATTGLDDTNHYHYPDSGGQFVMSGQGSGLSAGLGPGTGYSLGLSAGRSSQHAHPVSGTTANNSAVDTGNNKQNHAHQLGAQSLNGTSGAASGAVSVTNANMPKYLAVSYIIRAA